MKPAVVCAVLPASRRVSAGNGALLSATACFGALCAPLAARAADMNAVNNAAKMASTVGAGTAVPALGFGAVLQTIVGLVVVIGLVFGCAWLARRFGLQPGSRSGLVKDGRRRVARRQGARGGRSRSAIRGSCSARRRATCVCLHTMPAGSVAVDAVGNAQAGTPGGTGSTGSTGASGTTLSGSFGQRFRDALRRRSEQTFQRARQRGFGNAVQSSIGAVRAILGNSSRR